MINGGAGRRRDQRRRPRASRRHRPGRASVQESRQRRQAAVHFFEHGATTQHARCRREARRSRKNILVSAMCSGTGMGPPPSHGRAQVSRRRQEHPSGRTRRHRDYKNPNWAPPPTSRRITCASSIQRSTLPLGGGADHRGRRRRGSRAPHALGTWVEQEIADHALGIPSGRQSTHSTSDGVGNTSAVAVLATCGGSRSVSLVSRRAQASPTISDWQAQRTVAGGPGEDNPVVTRRRYRGHNEATFAHAQSGQVDVDQRRVAAGEPAGVQDQADDDGRNWHRARLCVRLGRCSTRINTGRSERVTPT